MGNSDEPLAFSQEAIKEYEADLLESKPHARALAKTLLSLETGSVVAVLGEWGHGKTSFLNMVGSYLPQHANELGRTVKTIDIPLWKYEKVSDLIYAIARDANEQTISGAGRLQRGASRYGKRSLSALFVLLRMLKLTLPWAPIEVSVNDKPEELKKQTDTIDHEAFVDKEAFEKCIEFFNKSTTPKSDEEVIVFLDDIDRVAPESAFDLLETIKMLLINTQCRFVFAMDHGVLRHAVAAKYGNLGYQDPERFAAGYLDKLVDLTVCLPLLTVEDAEKFLDKLQAEYPKHAGLSEAERCVLLAGVPLNPRAIKRLIAALYHEKLVLEELKAVSTGGTIQEAKRVKRLILQMFYPNVVDWALLCPKDFATMQMGDEVHWAPSADLPLQARKTGSKLLSEAEHTLRNESGRKILAWVEQYAPYVWGFLQYTPCIDVRSFGHSVLKEEVV